MAKAEIITCSDCGKKLIGDDEVFIDTNGTIYCSTDCLLDNNVEEETTAQKLIDDM